MAVTTHIFIFINIVVFLQHSGTRFVPSEWSDGAAVVTGDNFKNVVIEMKSAYSFIQNV